MKLTMGRARQLIKRELGLSAARLTAPPQMNQNHQYPWYELITGNLHITVYTNEYMDGKMIALSMSFDDGLGRLHRFFYADSMEEAPEYTERRYWQDIKEVADEHDLDKLAQAMGRKSREAYLAHVGKER